jgi:ribonuclease VapC
MVVDTSALIAILQDEPEAEGLTRAILSAPSRKISAPSMLEARIITLSRFGEAGLKDLELLVVKLGLETVSFTKELGEVAFNAYRRFGRGNHPAKLNFGDCFSYALARINDEGLLFKGDDFSKTDVPTANY